MSTHSITVLSPDSAALADLGRERVREHDDGLPGSVEADLKKKPSQ